jgi:hypothetical protein
MSALSGKPILPPRYALRLVDFLGLDARKDAKVMWNIFVSAATAAVTESFVRSLDHEYGLCTAPVESFEI